MIDFRYHLVSIIAIFLALAVGLLVGSTYIPGYAEEALSHTEKAVTQENDALSAANKALRQQVTADNAFAQAGARQLLAPGGDGLLDGQKVVLVAAPGTDSQMTAGITTALKTAGATVTGEILLQPAFFDGSGQTESSLSQLARTLVPIGVSLPSTSANPAIAGQQDAAAVIAASIVNKDGVGLGSAESRSILAGFAQAGYLQVQNGASSLAPATLAVLLTPATAQPQTANQVLVAMAGELQAASRGTVMSGSVAAIAPNSAIAMVGGGGPVSTVDNADTEIGQIIVAQALAELATGKSPAAWGIDPGAAPSPAPTPSPTPTPSATGSSQVHR